MTLEGGRALHVPAFPVETVDTTGAGDSFNAGFLHAWLQRAPVADCLRLGRRVRGAQHARPRRDGGAADARGGGGAPAAATALSATAPANAAAAPRTPLPGRIGRYRWWIGGLLFASTFINYLDRQTLNVLGPSLKTEFHWSNQDFALIIIVVPRRVHADADGGRARSWTGSAPATASA